MLNYFCPACPQIALKTYYAPLECIKMTRARPIHTHLATKHEFRDTRDPLVDFFEFQSIVGPLQNLTLSFALNYPMQSSVIL